jgi:hypothetical protein
MNISTVAGQPIEFWIAMVDADAQNALLAADSAPTLAVASKNAWLLRQNQAEQRSMQNTSTASPTTLLSGSFVEYLDITA